jgi:hypothetical protein
LAARRDGSRGLFRASGLRLYLPPDRRGGEGGRQDRQARDRPGIDERRLDASDRWAHLQVAHLTKALRLADASIERGELKAVGPMMRVVAARDRYHELGPASASSRPPASEPPAALVTPPLALPAPPPALTGPMTDSEGEPMSAAAAVTPSLPEGADFWAGEKAVVCATGGSARRGRWRIIHVPGRATPRGKDYSRRTGSASPMDVTIRRPVHTPPAMRLPTGAIRNIGAGIVTFW